MTGPLQGVKLVEMAGIGPSPLCGMLLGDMGAEVLRIDRPHGAADLGIAVERRYDIMNRSKRAVALDLKREAGREAAMALISSADILIEGFRPGVMERLGLGPEACLSANPRLVYGRMTGFGQEGALSAMAGHDINFIAMTGALHAIGPRGGRPVPPLNLVGDFGAGALYLAMGVLAALHAARASGRGQVVDAAMLDGVASLMAMMYGLSQAGLWRNARGENLLDGGAPWYDTYRTRDGRYMAVGAIEERFYAEFLRRLGLEAESLPPRHDPGGWDALRARFAEAFAQKTQAEWEDAFAQSDGCVSPVLDMEACMAHPALAARGMFVTLEGVRHPAPAPRFARTPAAIARAPVDPRADTRAALAGWGFSPARIAALAEAGAIAPEGGDEEAR